MDPRALAQIEKHTAALNAQANAMEALIAEIRKSREADVGLDSETLLALQDETLLPGKRADYPRGIGTRRYRLAGGTRYAHQMSYTGAGTTVVIPPLKGHRIAVRRAVLDTHFDIIAPNAALSSSLIVQAALLEEGNTTMPATSTSAPRGQRQHWRSVSYLDPNTAAQRQLIIHRVWVDPRQSPVVSNPGHQLVINVAANNLSATFVELLLEWSYEQELAD